MQLSLDEIRKDYHDFLLEKYKDWNKPGTKTDTAAQRVSDTLYLWNHGNKRDFWMYLSGQKDKSEAHDMIRKLLAKAGASVERQEGYCGMFDEFGHYFDVQWGGISSVIDEDHIEVNGVVAPSEVKKYRYIKASDNISFSYNYQALNACFGAQMRGSLEYATWNSKDGCLVWFPHLAKIENGRYLPGSKQVNWKNYFEDNGNIIIQMLYPGEMINDNDREPIFRPSVMPMHTFMKMGDHDFRYVGTYMLDYKSSTPRFQIVRRIKDSIDLSVWADGYDTDYLDTEKSGKDVFKDLYIEKSFIKQKKYIDSFLKNELILTEEEQRFNNIRDSFLSGFGMATIKTMGDERFDKDFVPELVQTLNSLFLSSYTAEYIKSVIGSWNEFGKTWADLLFETEVSVNDRIRNCAWGTELASQIYTIYDENSEKYLYTVKEKDIDGMLFALGIKMSEADDLVEKQSRLYYWRYCDDEILEWSAYRYYQFLCFIAGVRKRSISYIQAAKPDVANRIRSEEKAFEEELSKDIIDDAPQEYEYSGVPRLREINVNAKRSQGAVVPRHYDRKINALVKAGYCCEIDKKHPTFKRRNSDKNYTETHHLIPLEYSAQFEYTLDTEENIVSLCSNCHNQIHYGDGAEKLLKVLFEERKDALSKAGLGETIDGISLDYVQLLHMYGLE